MKKLTIAQAARELNTIAAQRLSSSAQDAFVKIRLTQFTDSVDAAITQLQGEVQQLRKDLDALKK